MRDLDGWDVHLLKSKMAKNTFLLRWIDLLTYAKYGNPEPERRVELPEEEWKERLNPAEYPVLRQKGTEPPFRNIYCRWYESGLYACAGCGSLLFRSTEKYHAISSWPSFTQPISKGAVKYFFDDSFGMKRVEVQCNVCDGHLGHVFPDGPEPGGLRYCINSLSLSWKRDGPGDERGGVGAPWS